MFDVTEFAWIAIGVAVATLHPVLLALIRKEFPLVTAGGMPPWLKRSLLLFAFSVVTALIVLAVYRNAVDPTTSLTWFKAFVLGYGWEAFIEKWMKKA
jgi:hypothetical protein